MRKRTWGAESLTAPLIPRIDDAASSDLIDPDVLASLLGNPAFNEIARTLACAAHIELDPTDPDVLARCIRIGEQRHANEGGSASRQPRDRIGVHEPVIYYMQIGGAVKIGTTRSIVTRHCNLGQPLILAIERGGVDEERDRLALFAPLRMHGEWFRDEDPLSSYVRAVAEAFVADFGMDMESWVSFIRESSRPA